jgi:hypothetical protein
MPAAADSLTSGYRRRKPQLTQKQSAPGENRTRFLVNVLRLPYIE